MSPSASSSCECGSALAYRVCCKPLHQGQLFAETPDRLVRARFCAFARKEVDFLWRTLHPHHPDRAEGGVNEREVRLALRDACIRFRYARLHLLGAREDEVLFVAEMYERGKECSFVERSRFARDAEGNWAYVGGENRACRASEVPTLSWENGP